MSPELEPGLDLVLVMGFLGVTRTMTDSQDMMSATCSCAGVKLEGVGVVDGLGQQYITPEEAVGVRHSDIIIVGRGITQVR